ncbi:MAG: hypothetical protein EZS28_041932 [Streblomastix strix]|uniref:Uncharacterized protein n=1 Tax=Streblomastix strix TaxID=222440 RepID=A0A5J4TY30_9EUKA|nr:MAG: hypothetical protein EZS28_041932 [Streblomastix strix]
MKERIYPLIHLNCQTDINCQQCINIPQSLALLELKSAVFLTLSEVSWINYKFIDTLQEDNIIISHLTHPLIQFASQSQFNKKTDSQEQQNNQQQSESSSSISLITSSINLLNNLINNNNNKCKEVHNTPNALHSLTTLSIYKIGTHLSQENDQQTLALRSGSKECLWHIQYFGDAFVHSELVNANYTGVLVIAISTASGSGEEYDEDIYKGLDRIYIFICNLKQGKQYNATFPPQTLLARRSDEQIEEEGGNEEIDSQQINKGFSRNIKLYANIAKGAILNYFIEQGNQRPYWYK